MKQLQKILAKLSPIADMLKVHRVTIFIVCFFAIYAFLVLRISSLVNSEPDPATLGERLQTVKRLKIDQTSIDRMLEMEEQNIEIQTLFEQARQNPFTE